MTGCNDVGWTGRPRAQTMMKSDEVEAMLICTRSAGG